MAFINLPVILLRRISIMRKPLTALFCDLRPSEVSLFNENRQQTSPLLKSLKNARSSAELFSIISNNNKAFDDQHAIQALKMIFEFYKTEKLSLTSDPTFEKLCVRLRLHSRNMEVHDIIDAIKILNFVGVSVNSTIFQVFLQSIRQRINEINIQQIIFLDYLLTKMDSNNLISSLKMAMPLLFQIQIVDQLNQAKISHLSDYLSYAYVHDIPMKYTTSIATHLLMNINNLDVVTAKNIILNTCKSNIEFKSKSSVFYKLISASLDRVADNLNTLNLKDVFSLLDNVKRKIINDKYDDLYNEDFFNACGQYAIDNNIPFNHSVSIAKYLSRVAHTHKKLLSYISELTVIEPEILENAGYSSIFYYINALSNANYKPNDWDQIQIYLFENNLFKETKIEMPWAKFSVELASLDCYNEDLLNKMFSKEFLDEYLDRTYSLLDSMQLLLLDLATKVIYKTYKRGLPEDIRQKIMSKMTMKDVDRFISAGLEVALEGKDNFMSSILLPNGSNIDFLILFDENNKPIPISNVCDISSKLELNNFLINYKNKLLCILNLHRGCYSLNTNQLRGIFDLTQRVLENDGYHVLTISSKEYMALQPIERIQFLNREIALKTNNNFT